MDGAAPSGPVYTAPAAAPAPAAEAAQSAAPLEAGELDRIIAVVNNDVITEHELERRSSSASFPNARFCSAPVRRASAWTTRW